MQFGRYSFGPCIGKEVETSTDPTYRREDRCRSERASLSTSRVFDSPGRELQSDDEIPLSVPSANDLRRRCPRRRDRVDRPSEFRVVLVNPRQVSSTGYCSQYVRTGNPIILCRTDTTRKGGKLDVTAVSPRSRVAGISPKQTDPRSVPSPSWCTDNTGIIVIRSEVAQRCLLLGHSGGPHQYTEQELTEREIIYSSPAT